MSIDTPRIPDKPKRSGASLALVKWPKRDSEGIGLSFKDGWNFGAGFGLAMTIAVPAILLIIGCFIGIIISVFGGVLGAML